MVFQPKAIKPTTLQRVITTRAEQTRRNQAEANRPYRGDWDETSVDGDCGCVAADWRGGCHSCQSAARCTGSDWRSDHRVDQCRAGALGLLVALRPPRLRMAWRPALRMAAPPLASSPLVSFQPSRKRAALSARFFIPSEIRAPSGDTAPGPPPNPPAPSQTGTGAPAVRAILQSPYGRPRRSP